MNAIFSARMLEATRLVRTGRLREASALLQGALGRDAAPEAGQDCRNAPDGGANIIDIDPATGEVLAPPTAEPAAHRDAPRPWRKGAFKKAPAAAPESLPDGALFESRSFSSPAGHRDYKLFVPSGSGTRPVPLIVMLHGCTQSPDDFAAGTRMNALAEEHGCLVLYPEQSKAANAQKCWNWFSPDDQSRGRGEPALIAGMTQRVVRDHAVDASRIYVAGLSAGGAAAAVMAQTYPDIYAAAGVHSGLPCGAARDVPTAFAAMRQGAPASQQRLQVPTIVFHADRDATVHPRNGDLVAAQVDAMGAVRVETHSGQVPGGHAYRRTIHLTATGTTVLEQWLIHGAGHAWSGGSTRGSYTDPRGPDASREILRFFLQHSRTR